MGRGKLATDDQRLCIGVVVAAADRNYVSKWEVVARALEIARLLDIQWDRQDHYLANLSEERDGPWASVEERKHLRENVTPLLSLAMWTGEDSAWSWANKCAPPSVAADGIPDVGDEDLHRSIQIQLAGVDAGTKCLSMSTTYERICSGTKPGEAGILPTLVGGLTNTLEQFLRERLFTFECSACSQIGFRIGRHGLAKKSRFCSVRCDRNPYPSSLRAGRPNKVWLQPWEAAAR